MDKQKEYTSFDVDQMFWHYCIGVLHTANSLRFRIHPNLDQIVQARHRSIERAYGIAPSFKISFVFDWDHSTYRIKEKPKAFHFED